MEKKSVRIIFVWTATINESPSLQWCRTPLDILALLFKIRQHIYIYIFVGLKLHRRPFKTLLVKILCHEVRATTALTLTNSNRSVCLPRILYRRSSVKSWKALCHSAYFAQFSNAAIPHVSAPCVRARFFSGSSVASSFWRAAILNFQWKFDPKSQSAPTDVWNSRADFNPAARHLPGFVGIQISPPAKRQVERLMKS